MSELQTGKAIGVTSCLVCHLIIDMNSVGVETVHCPRCHNEVSFRKKYSIGRCWAYLSAAFILYIPANIFPIMTLTSFARQSKETILSGIIQLFHTGQWGIGIVVFIASVFVPIFKIAALAFLTLSVQFDWQWNPFFRSRLYRFVEWIGRWSMIDIFMISILVTIVSLKELASIEPGVGAMAFAAVVVLTMLASRAFDPRLIWDKLHRNPDHV
ncbi:paraquat-inducible protein A [Sneathiella glossodoripedis]|uniref:paraquat-inducible protein A n=1 Tax=Sneathiella glossodoripedis TaxID=418853 RepID=UPI0004706C2C|nr:paraquat-inducible protein A [Sneathiella glossodoripedis]